MSLRKLTLNQDSVLCHFSDYRGYVNMRQFSNAAAVILFVQW
jgi:hypothetical protein